NSCTSLVFDFSFASLPASMSTWLAVTTIAAIWASLGPPSAAKASGAARSNAPAHAACNSFIRDSCPGLGGQALDVTGSSGVPATEALSGGDGMGRDQQV